MARSEIGIIIPAYNEAGTISNVVKNLDSIGSIIVVDDGSSDNTAELASSAGAFVVKHKNNMGYDKALSSGFEFANQMGCTMVVTIDADNQHDSSVLPLFFSLLGSGADIVLGERNYKQRISEHVFGFFSTVLWGIRDPLCGLKAYKISLYRELGYFDSYDSIGTELAIYAAKKLKTIHQVPIKIRNRLDKPRFKKNLSANFHILRALYIGIFKRYN